MGLRGKKEEKKGNRGERGRLCTKGRKREMKGGGVGWSPLVGTGKRDGRGMCKNLIEFGGFAERERR